MGSFLSTRRNFPPDLKEASKHGLAHRGDMVVRQDGNVSVTVWQDTWPVTFMSSGHNPDHTRSVRRKKVDGSRVEVDCPECIVDYNKFMAGVDKGDQYRGYYHVRMKSRKCYKYIFWFPFEVCVLNSFILSRYSPCNHPNTTYLSFRTQLAKELIGTYCSRKHHIHTCTLVHYSLVCNAQHYPLKTNKGWCKYPSCPRQTVWYCVL